MINTIIKPIIAVIGAGSYGTALAIALSRNGHNVVLWGHNSNYIKKLKINRYNHIYLPNVPFPPSLFIEESLPVVLNSCQDFLIAVPSYVFNQVLTRFKLNVKRNIRVIIASKGLDPDTGQFLHDTTYKILGKNIPIAVISGPTFATELAMGLPTVMTISSTDVKLGDDIQNLLLCDKNFRVYRDMDIIGAQIAGIIKNIIAIGAGISDGMGFGSNARAALITRGLVEMCRFGMAMGATPGIFLGLAGLGDMILTCTDNKSRNRRFGILLGEGMDIHNAKKKIGQTIEGILNTREIYILSSNSGIIMPITEQIYEILYNSKNVCTAAYDLLRRSQQKSENMIFSC